MKVRFVLGEFSVRETDDDLLALGAPRGAAHFLFLVDRMEFVSGTVEVEHRQGTVVESDGQGVGNDGIP